MSMTSHDTAAYLKEINQCRFLKLFCMYHPIRELAVWLLTKILLVRVNNFSIIFNGLVCTDGWPTTTAFMYYTSYFSEQSQTIPDHIEKLASKNTKSGICSWNSTRPAAVQYLHSPFSRFPLRKSYYNKLWKYHVE